MLVFPRGRFAGFGREIRAPAAPRPAEVEMEAGGEKRNPGFSLPPQKKPKNKKKPKTQQSAEKRAPGIAGAALSSGRCCRSRRAAPSSTKRSPTPHGARTRCLPSSAPPLRPGGSRSAAGFARCGRRCREAAGAPCGVPGSGFFPLRFKERSSLGCKTLRGGSAGTEGFAFLEAAHGKYAAMRRRRKVEGSCLGRGRCWCGSGAPSYRSGSVRCCPCAGRRHGIVPGAREMGR